MKFTTALMLLRILAKQTNGMTTAEISNAWPPTKDDPPNIRSFQRYMDELSASVHRLPALVDADDGRPCRYTINRGAIASWFMTDEVALYLQLTNQYLTQPLAGVEALAMDATQLMAQQALNNALRTTRHIHDYLRLVPDGLGRLPAKIEPKVIREVMQAITANKRLLLDYTNAQGVSRKHELNVHGLVMKDGTLYLIASKGIENRLITFALQRAQAAEVSNRHARRVLGFDLDEYLTRTNQLSHPLDSNAEMIDLRLRVLPSAIFHFRERPLCANQIILEAASDGSFEVQAQVPNTILLFGFLLSHTGTVEVIQPAALRSKIGELVRVAAEAYEQDRN